MNDQSHNFQRQTAQKAFEESLQRLFDLTREGFEDESNSDSSSTTGEIADWDEVAEDIEHLLGVISDFSQVIHDDSGDDKV